MPTDNYTLDEAVRDGFLVPPKAVSVPLRFQREGISYEQLSGSLAKRLFNARLELIGELDKKVTIVSMGKMVADSVARLLRLLAQGHPTMR